MEDSRIIQLFFDRDEQAVRETDQKYGGYCYSIAYHILSNRENSEESVNDTYLSAWNSIPPRKPNPLAPFLGRIVRHISIDRWRKNGALNGAVERCCLRWRSFGSAWQISKRLRPSLSRRSLRALFGNLFPNCLICSRMCLCAVTGIWIPLRTLRHGLGSRKIRSA